MIVVALLVVAIMATILFLALAPPSQGSSFERSGPISSFPAAWVAFCPGSPTQGNTTTTTDLLPTYPNSWNASNVVTLEQVYSSIIYSSPFMSVAVGHGWVVDSWAFDQGGSTNMPPGSDDILGVFILTNGLSPDGYVYTFYDIQNGAVGVEYQATMTVACPATLSS